MLGPERFIAMYADGLETFGYRNGPLETMAYSLQGRFESSPMIFDAEFAVKTQLKA
jgi:hypothetical protein